MPTIEELEAEVAAAEKRFNEARDDLNAAKRQLQIAINEASGIIGHVLEFQQSWGKRPLKRIVVDCTKRTYRGTLCAYGVLVLKDGRIGVRRDDVEVDKAKDLGPYVAPAAEQEKSR